MAFCRRGAWAIGTLFIGILGIGGPPASQAQQTAVTTPFQAYSDSFYENFGFGWGYSRVGPRGGFFFNGPGMAPPPFGQADPNAGARFGFARVGNGARFSFNMVASQGSSRTNSVQAPSVVVPNGGQGFISSSVLRPLVTGLIPVVGQRQISPLQQRLQRLREDPSLMQRGSGTAPAGVQRRRASSSSGDDAPRMLDQTDSSSAAHGDVSVSRILQQQAAQQAAEQQEVAALIERGVGHQQRGQLGVAIIYFRQAARRADGELAERLQQRIERLDRIIHERSAARS